MTASEINMTHSSDKHWGILTEILDDLQSKVSERTINSIPALLEAITQSEKLPGITHQELSIVYRDYRQSRCRWVVHEGAIVTHPDRVEFSADNPLILRLLESEAQQNYPVVSGADECRRAGFDGCQSVLIVPMKLDDRKRIGAFVLLHKTNVNAYDQAIGRVLDVFGDRVALLIYMIQQRLREKENAAFNRFLLNESGNMTRECQVLERVIEKIRSWYQDDVIYILMKSPLDTKKYYLTNQQDIIQQSFRLHDTLIQDEFDSIVGGKENFDAMISSQFQYTGGFTNLPSVDFPLIKPNVRSWLGATIYHAEGFPLGHIVLHNTEAKYAYGEDDAHLLSNVCSTTGLLLSKIRADKKEKAITGFDELKNSEDLYNAALTYLESSYGVKSLLIYRIATTTQDWDVAFQSGIFTEPDQNFRTQIIKTAEKYRQQINDAERKKQSVEFPLNSGDKYLVVPMRTKDVDGDFRVVGCFVIPSQDQGIVATRIIDEVSDALAKRLKELDDDNRQKKLNKFIKEVSKLSPNDLTIKKSLEMAGSAIAEIMFSANLFFALYEREINEISFPIIYQNGKPWEKLWGSKRPLDKEKRGRTEEIILTEKPILIKTLPESKAWYQQPGRQEFAGNPLASWIGVPIFDDTGVRGVIAVYHPDLEYVYSKRDLWLLENVAGAVSTLFRMVDLRDANQKATEMTASIIEKEKHLTETLLIRDFSHHLNNQLGAFGIDTKEIRRDIDSAMKTGSISKLERTIDILDDLDIIVDSLLKQSDFGKKQESEDIDLRTLINELIGQAKTIFKLFDIEAIIEINELTSVINTNYHILYNCIQILIDNASESFNDFSSSNSPYIKIHSTLDENSVFIDIIDNGKPIPVNIKNQLFEYGVSSKEKDGGYGLWRARMLASSLGGSLEYIDEQDKNIKHFRLTIPFKNKLRLPMAVIIDDERPWRNIVSRWLKENDVDTNSASSYEEAVKLLYGLEGKPIDLVFLDISLDRKKGSDVSGLSLIQVIKKTHPKSKVILLTGYSKNAASYANDIALIIDKVKDGEVLTEDKFRNSVKGFLSNATTSV